MQLVLRGMFVRCSTIILYLYLQLLYSLSTVRLLSFLRVLIINHVTYILFIGTYTRLDMYIKCINDTILYITLIIHYNVYNNIIILLDKLVGLLLAHARVLSNEIKFIYIQSVSQ